jgi:fumarylpyruvate hydrolase
MGGDDRDPPFFFGKPADAAVSDGKVAFPSRTRELHHEIELVVALGAGGISVQADRALSLVFGYAAGVDLTRRDLQAAAKDKGRPWDAAKGFDASAPIGPIRRWSGPPPAGTIRLWVNDSLKQEGEVADMIWGVAEIIVEASNLWRLAPGDLIFTGTPEGVGPLRIGDSVRGEIESVGAVSFTIAAGTVAGP